MMGYWFLRDFQSVSLVYSINGMPGCLPLPHNTLRFERIGISIIFMQTLAFGTGRGILVITSGTEALLSKPTLYDLKPLHVLIS